VKSFNGRLRHELQTPEIFDTLLKARVLGGWWRQDYNRVRPHSSLGYRSPTPEPSRQWPAAHLANDRAPNMECWHYPRGAGQDREQGLRLY
jgi:transposase InsO family protein